MDLNSSIGKKIKSLRRHAGMTLVELGEETGLSAGFLSLVENGKTSLSLDTLNSIAQGLDVEATYFLATQEGQNGPVIIRKYDQSSKNLKRGRSEVLLTDLSQNFNIKPSIVTLPPFESKPSAAPQFEGDFFLYVIDGILNLQLGQEVRILYPNDSAHFSGRIPCCFWNESPHVTHVFTTQKIVYSNETLHEGGKTE